MKKKLIIFLILIISIFFVSCSSTHAASKFNSGVVMLPMNYDVYEWSYILSDNSIRIHKIELPLISDINIYEITPTRNGIFRIVFNCINSETNEIKYIASYNIEVYRNKILVVSEDFKELIGDNYKDKKAIPLSILGEQEDE